MQVVKKAIKWALVQLFVWCALSSLAQTKTTVSQLYVSIVMSDTVYTSYTFVHVGTLEDRLCVYIEGEIGYPYDVPHCIFDLRFTKPGLLDKSDQTAVGYTELGQKYSIRQVRANDGYIIFICNLYGRFPHILISTHRPVQLQNN